MIDSARSIGLIRFGAIPQIGQKITLRQDRRGRGSYTLIGSAPCHRCDGTQGTILHWLDDAGFSYTSGLKSNGMTRIHTGQSPFHRYLSLIAVGAMGQMGATNGAI